ncbi:MAG: alpha/beta fold hydrolase [Actinomycetota bacterium]|nr:alpha/beta fold hydrolase [Actinomycetota bacterium]
MRLHHVTEGDGSPVVLVHGFTQTLASWDAVATDLAVYRRIVRVDLPGHGGSRDVRAHLDETAALVGEAGGEAVYVGYSLGGRVCLRLAVDRPELVRGLVLVSASPGIDDNRERTARRLDDEKLAAEIERGGVDAFLVRWLAQPMFASLPRSTLDDRRVNTADGLASSLRLAGTGVMEPLWERLADLTMPVELIVGERDEKFVAIAKRMRELLPGRPRLARVPGAGHAAHLEDPAMVAAFIERFLVRHAPVTS